MIAPSPQVAFNHVFQLLSGTTNGLLWIRRLLGYRDRLLILKACFHQAALVVNAALVTIYITDMHLNSGDVVIETIQHAFNYGFRMIRKFLVTFYITIGIDLNVHYFSFSYEIYINGAVFKGVQANAHAILRRGAS